MSTEAKIAPPTNQPPVPTTISILKPWLQLWYKLHVLLYDLTNFIDSVSNARLDSVASTVPTGPDTTATTTTARLTVTSIIDTSPKGENNKGGKTLTDAIMEEVGRVQSEGRRNGLKVKISGFCHPRSGPYPRWAAWNQVEAHGER